MVFVWRLPFNDATLGYVVADFLDRVDEGHWFLYFVIVSVSPILESDSDRATTWLVAEWIGAEFILYFHWVLLLVIVSKSKRFHPGKFCVPIWKFFASATKGNFFYTTQMAHQATRAVTYTEFYDGPRSDVEVPHGRPLQHPPNFPWVLWVLIEYRLPLLAHLCLDASRESKEEVSVL